MEVYKLNDMREFDIEASPNIIWYELQSFNFNIYDQKLKLNVNFDKKCFEVINEYFNVKVKFYEMDKNRLRVKFNLKEGSLMKWYEVLK